LFVCLKSSVICKNGAGCNNAKFAIKRNVAFVSMLSLRFLAIAYNLKQAAVFSKVGLFSSGRLVLLAITASNYMTANSMQQSNVNVAR